MKSNRPTFSVGRFFKLSEEDSHILKTILLNKVVFEEIFLYKLSKLTLQTDSERGK